MSESRLQLDLAVATSIAAQVFSAALRFQAFFLSFLERFLLFLLSFQYLVTDNLQEVFAQLCSDLPSSRLELEAISFRSSYTLNLARKVWPLSGFPLSKDLIWVYFRDSNASLSCLELLPTQTYNFTSSHPSLKT